MMIFSQPTWAMNCVAPYNMVEVYPVIFKGRVSSIIDNPELKEVHDKIVDMFEVLRDKHGEKGYGSYIWATMFMGDPKITTFDVIETYKGVLPKEIQIYHAAETLRGEPRRGGVSYDLGETYIIFADVNENNRYMPSACGTHYKPDSENRHVTQIRGVRDQIDALNTSINSAPKNVQLILKKAEILEGIQDFQRLENLYAEALKTFEDDDMLRKGLERAVKQKKAYLEKQSQRDGLYHSPINNKDEILSITEQTFLNFMNEMDD